MTYVGRFAPSPTGPLHFGSLVAALGSCLDARAHGGAWLLRMEDLDRPREVPGAADAILRTLQACGFEWDGPVLYQSRRTDAYAAAVDALQRRGALFPCACTRRELADSAIPAGVESELVYPGTCRSGLPSGRRARALRVRVGDAVIGFADRLQGPQQQRLAAQVGDFVVRRADGLHAYQLAVVVDDAWQGVTDVVRGADLLASTPRQILLQRLLGYPQPRYLHLPVALTAAGEKLSKQTLAAPVQTRCAGQALAAALAFLGQRPPGDLHERPLAEIWQWARRHWSTDCIPGEPGLPAPPGASGDH